MKDALRSEMRLRRGSLDAEERRSKSSAISKKFRNLPEYWDVKNIMVYVSFGSEVETWGLIEDLLSDKKRVFVPVMGKDCAISAVEIKSFEPEKMVKNQFGVLEPRGGVKKAVPPHELGTVIAPGLAFDEKGTRLGFGGGCYDKFLHELHALQKKIPVVGLAFDFQVLPAGKIPREGHDKEVDVVITEMRVIRCK
ncbi:MAG: 5-formyltetrahydrofolate cyclo-ligase [Candidatus Diapherotrites archaeon]